MNIQQLTTKIHILEMENDNGDDNSNSILHDYQYIKNIGGENSENIEYIRNKFLKYIQIKRAVRIIQKWWANIKTNRFNISYKYCQEYGNVKCPCYKIEIDYVIYIQQRWRNILRKKSRWQECNGIPLVEHANIWTKCHSNDNYPKKIYRLYGDPGEMYWEYGRGCQECRDEEDHFVMKGDGYKYSRDPSQCKCNICRNKECIRFEQDGYCTRGEYCNNLHNNRKPCTRDNGWRFDDDNNDNNGCLCYINCYLVDWKKIKIIINDIDIIDKIMYGFWNPNELFYLADKGITGDDCKYLAPVLAKMTELKELILNLNNIDDEGCRYLTKCLVEMKGLEILDLIDNNISDEGCHHLAKALAEMTSLKELDLRDNNIGEDGKKMIREAWEEAGKHESDLWL